MFTNYLVQYGLDRSWLLAVLAFLLVSVFIEITVPIARKSGLVDRPNGRKQHEGVVPLLGGIAIFCVVLLMAVLFLKLTVDYIFIFSSIALLVITGSLDDRLDLDFKIRLGIQFLCASILIVGSDISIVTLGNLVGIGELQLGWSAIPFTIVLISALINAFNMADGMDGLAGGLSLVAFVMIFSQISGFVSTEIWSLLVVIQGALAAYLVHNLGFMPKRLSKVFLGDAGSMMLGLTVSVFLIQYSQPWPQYFKPITALWFVALPFVDMVATFLRRILNGKSPFFADRTHIHHILLRLGLRPKVALLVLVGSAVCLANFGVWVERLFDETISFILFCCFTFIYTLLLLRSWRVTRFIRRFVRS